jgi:sporulation and spore germination protein/immunoglobulin-like protein involved in spore germination
MRYVIVILSAVLAGLVGFGAASCGTQEGAQVAGPAPSGATTPGSGNEPPATTDGSGTTGSSAEIVTLDVWFTRGESVLGEDLTQSFNPTLWSVKRTIPATQRVGAASLAALLDGPNDEEITGDVGTAVPEGTQLLGLEIGDGVATVNLSSEFESGGGSLSMTMRLAQVVYTLTQFQTVKGVQFELDGRPVDVFSGEGIVLDHPVGRKDYEQLLPTILVNSPTPWAEVSNPVTIAGSANVFEANVTVRILDEQNREIAHTFTTATCGTGCRGTFSVAVPYEVDERQQGVILVQDDDAAGVGKPPHEVRIPVILVP